MKFSIKYKPLFDLPRVPDFLGKKSPEGAEHWEKLSKVDTVIMTGGRGSAKSKGAGDMVTDATFIYDWRTLYTRFTNASLKDSVHAEVCESVSALDYDDDAIITDTKIESKCGDGYISFKGIKTGQKSQKANLKSLKGFNCVVIDEAEEIPDYDTFKKLFYSIRSVKFQNVSILIFNPPEDDHWIFEEFFNKKGVEPGSNVIVDNVMYIHTSYLDVPKEYIPENIRKDYERLKEEDPDEYDNVVMGGFRTAPKGALFIKKDLQFFKKKHLDKSKFEATFGYGDIADQGNDYLAYAQGPMIGKKIFITDVVFSQDNTDVTFPLVKKLIKKKKPEVVQIESNSQGAKFARDLAAKCSSTSIVPIHNSANKNTRIISQYGFIKKYFVFLDKSEYDYDSDYAKFMKQVYKWKKEETNQPDDAPDCLSGLANFLGKYLSHLY